MPTHTPAAAPLLTQAIFKQLVAAAVRAPSGHNAQAWRFALDTASHTIRITPDLSRALPVVDPDNRELFISLGCAAQNVIVAGRACGLVFVCDSSGPDGIRLHVQGACPADPAGRALVLRRRTDRRRYDGRPLSRTDHTAITDFASEPGVTCRLIDDRPRLAQLAQLIATGNAAQYQNPAFVRELLAWMRFNRREAARKADGLSSAALTMPAWPVRWLGLFIVRRALTAAAQTKRDHAALASAAGVLVIASAADTPAAWVRTGLTLQRLLLMLTDLDVHYAYLNQPCETGGTLRHALAALTDQPDAHPQLVLRVGYRPGHAPAASYRRAVSEVS